MRRNIFLALHLPVLLFTFQRQALFAQNPDSNNYVFALKKVLYATPVNNQLNTNTCWSFSVISFLESELLRTGKGDIDLSELYIIRHAYVEKAKKYIRLHGNMKFTDGGEPNDVADIIRKAGIVPEEVYPYSKLNETNNNGDMHIMLKAYVNNIISNEFKIKPDWMDGFNEILNSYMGEVPDTFVYNEKIWTAESFAKELELALDDYILITSFTHHPFYSEFILELPDNWSWGKAYNVPVDELIEIIDSSLSRNYTVVWSADITEKEFDFKNGMAILPEMFFENMNNKGKILQRIRQEGFDNYTTTDDHSMHITGTAEDQNNNKYYYMKNSWGTNNFYNGYMFVSEVYVKYKTIVIMVNSKAIPEKIAYKINTGI